MNGGSPNYSFNLTLQNYWINVERNIMKKGGSSESRSNGTLISLYMYIIN